MCIRDRDIGVVERAEQREIVEIGLAAVGPVLQVMTLEEEAVIAAGEAAGAVAQEQGALEGGGDGAGLAADGEWGGVGPPRLAAVLEAAARPRRGAGTP